MKEKILEKYNAFKVRNANYYKEAFLKLDQENKTTFNLAACVFGVYWMIYRRMWFSAIAYVVINAILMYIASIMCSNYNGVVLRYNEFFVCFLIAIGFFGNSIYRAELKWKIKKGYHLSKDFSSTSLVSLILVTLFSDIVKQLHGVVSAFGNDELASFKGHFTPVFIYAIVFCYEYYAYMNAEIEINEDSMNQYLEKKGDDKQAILAIIIAALYFLFVR